MTYADVYDVQVRLGRPYDGQVEVELARAKLGDVETLIRTRLGDLSLLDRDALVMVEAEAVVRVLRNPDAKTNERIDDYSWGRHASVASGLLYVTDEEWALLAPASPRGAFTIRPGASEYRYPDGVIW